MSTFKKLNTKLYQKPVISLTDDNIYWKQFGDPLLIKEFGPINHINFSSVEPYYFAVTCSVRIQLYNPITKLVTKNFSRFKESAYSGNFRSDGAFLCAGSEEKVVKLFDVSSKNLIRLYKGHTAPVHKVFFLPDKYKIASFSDDKSVKLWDLHTEKELTSFSDHTDYVRAGATCAVAPDVILSGSYDNTVKMFDTRTNQVVFNVNHGSPVESLLFLPTGGIFLSAGGTDIKIWDATAGGKLLGSVSQHHKTITCMDLASDNKRLLSGGLDRHVKIYDLSTFEVVHSMDYPNAILSLGVSKNDETLAVGLVDGLLCVSRRQEKQITKSNTKKKVASHKYASFSHNTIDVLVEEPETEKESQIDYCLRKFKFSEALDKALLPFVTNKRPERTVATIQELIRRRELHSAFAGRSHTSILSILRFFKRNLFNYRFTRVLLDAFDIFLDVYGENISSLSLEIQSVLKLLKRDIDKEIHLGNELMALDGAIEMLLTSSNVSEQTTKDVTLNLVPSARAKKEFVIPLR